MKELKFEGTSKSSDGVSYNDQIEISITKVAETITSADYLVDWTDKITIVPESGKTSTSYSVVKVFAIGSFHNNSEYKDNRAPC